MSGIPTRWIDLLKKLPFLNEAVWTSKYFVGGRVTPFGGRWERVRRLLDEVDRATRAGIKDRRRLLVFGGNDFWFDYLLPICAVLAGRGCQLDFLWWPYTYEPDLRQTERFRRWSAAFQPPHHDRLRLLNLMEYAPAEPTSEILEQAEMIARFDTFYFSQKEAPDLQGSPEDRSIYEFRRERNLEFLCRLSTFLQGRSYDSALTANAKMCELGAFHWSCTRTGLPCVSLDGFEADDQIVASQSRPCTDWNTDAIWETDAPHILTPEREKRVLARIAFRDNPELQTERWHTLQSTKLLAPEELRRLLRLDANRPVVLLCTNLAYDSAVIGQGRALPTMKDWYSQVIDWFAAKRPGWHLIVRTHPIEAKLEQPMSVCDFINQMFPQLPANVRLIRPEEKVNTYGLLPMVELGLVYTSTIGLEMSIRGLPVIVAGNVHYAGKGFTFDPATREEYFALLEEATGSRKLALHARQVELARCYFDVYFEKFPKKMPWRWSNMAKDMEQWPVSRLIAGDCPAEFIKTFDYLAGRKVPDLF